MSKNRQDITSAYNNTNKRFVMRLKDDGGYFREEYTFSWDIDMDSFKETTCLESPCHLLNGYYL